MPQAVGSQDRSDIAGEGDRIVEVVEHGDRGDDLGRFIADLTEVGRGEEIGHQGHIVRIVLPEFRAGGVDADALQALGRIGLERGAVIGADVQHGVAGLQVRQPLQEMDLLGEVAHHRGVQARAVAIVVSVHFGRVEAVRQLEQTTVRGPHQFERPTGDGFSRAGEHAGQLLLTQMEHGDQIAAPADATTFKTPITAVHFALGWRQPNASQRPIYRLLAPRQRRVTRRWT